VSERYDSEAPTASVGRNVIAVIGVDRYHHWPGLANAVRDARGASALFQQVGFEEITAPLLDDQATSRALQSLVTDDLMTLGADDSLVLFYAGHGGTRQHRLGNEVIKAGYLIPVDASRSPDKVSTWVDLEAWLRAVSLLPAKHILVVLDACHSGIALDPIIKWRDIGSWQDTPLATLRARRSRRIITSALDDQVALDSGPVHGHSLFTGCLIEGLTDGIRRGGGRVTTGSELGLYVQRRVQTYPNSRQTPDFGTFAFDDRGEMVIPLAVEPAIEPPARSGRSADWPAWFDLIDLDDSEPASVVDTQSGAVASGIDDEAGSGDAAVPAEAALRTDAIYDADAARHAGAEASATATAEVGANPGPLVAVAGGTLDVDEPAVQVAVDVDADVAARAREQAWAARESRRWELEEQARFEVLTARAELAERREQDEREREQRRALAVSKLGTRPVPAVQGEQVAAQRDARVEAKPESASTTRGTTTSPATPSLPPVPPVPPPALLPTEIAGPTVPTTDARRWIIIGVVGATLATTLIGYLRFGRESSRVDPPVDTGGPSDTRSPSAGPPAPDCPTGMVPVSAATFRMGSPDGTGDADEHPQHEVTLSAFCIDRTEVTVKAYLACVAARGCSAAPLTVSWSGYSAADVKLYSRFCNRDDRPEHPINCIDWNQATAYCAWAGKRLPSEAEWEYAARGGDGRAYPWGNEAPSAKRLNACGSECVAMAKRELNTNWAKVHDASDGWETTAPVGSFPDSASPFGALDMAGNVWEWTADWYGPYTAAAATNPRGAHGGSFLVIRGGGWDDYDAGDVRAANRDRDEASIRYFYVGFRCARGD